MTVDHVFPEDSGTGATEGDWSDAANFAAFAHHDNLKDYKASGLAITPDYGVPDFDLSAGKAFISDTAATTVNTAESRDQGVLFEVEVAARTGVALTDSTVNHVFIDVDLTTDDGVSLVVNTTGTPPSAPYLKIAEIDTTADTLDETFGAGPNGSYETLTVNKLNQPNVNVSSATTALAGRYYFCDTSGGSFTVTLPVSPSEGDWVFVALNVSGNTLTIDGNGANIKQPGTSTATISMSQSGQTRTIRYQTQDNTWMVI